MSNVIYDNTTLPSDKIDNSGAAPVLSNPTRKWSANDGTRVLQAIRDTRTVINGFSFNVKAYGALGDNSTDDSAAFALAITAAASTVNGSYGAWVDVPKGTYVLGTQLSLPNGVGLRGAGPTASILKAKNTFSATSLIRNTLQDGTQEFAFLESLQIQGNKGGGAVCSTAVVDFVSLFINSYIRDVVILNGSNVGLHVAASGTPGGQGPVLIENVWVDACDGHNVLLEETGTNVGAANGIVCVNLTSEHQATNKSAVYLKGLGRCAGWQLYNTHIEMGNVATGRTGITLDGVSHVLIDGVQLLSDPATVAQGILITNVAQNVGIQIRGVTNSNVITSVISDLKNTVTVGGVNVHYYVTPDVLIRGGMRFIPHTVAGSPSLVAQSSAGVDRAWFDDLGQLTGSSLNAGGVDIRGDVANNRPLILVPNAVSGFTNVYGYNFPVGGAGVLRFRSITGNFDVYQVGTDGTLFIYQALTCQADVTMQSGLNVAKQIKFSGEIAPPQITANQNDYSPTNMSTSTVLILTSDAARDITGFATGAAGRMIWVYNNGAQNITLKNLTTSAAGNQIQGRGAADTVLTPKTGAHLYYSGTIVKWIVLGDTL